MFSVIVRLLTVLSFLPLIECKTYAFLCDFKLNSLCGMQNGSPADPPTNNFTIQTSATVTYPDLGPVTDHSFLYWSRGDNLSEAALTNSVIHTGRFNQSGNMCVRFSYYMKSDGINDNTWLDVSTGGCYGASLYFIEVDQSNGWEVITVPLHNYTCAVSLSITVNQKRATRVALAFDYLMVDLCKDLDPTSTATDLPTQIWSVFLLACSLCFHRI